MYNTAIMDRIVFCDIDGTLLNSQHRISEDTLDAVLGLQRNGIGFAVVSARSPSGIYPIFQHYGFSCPIISYSGALILDEEGNSLFHKGIAKDDARAILSFIDEERLDLSYCIFSYDEWIVRSKADPRIRKEEQIVEAEAHEGDIDSITADEVSKILCICNPSETDYIEKKLKERFPEFSIVKSDDYLIEIMDAGVSKAMAVRILSELYGVDMKDTVAFGDNYNDEEMLQAVGHGFLMGNAPEALKARMALHAEDNDHDGIAKALRQIGLYQ